MCECKKDITPVCQQWSYVFLALTHDMDLLGGDEQVVPGGQKYTHLAIN